MFGDASELQPKMLLILKKTRVEPLFIAKIKVFFIIKNNFIFI